MKGGHVTPFWVLRGYERYWVVLLVKGMNKLEVLISSSISMKEIA